MMELNKLQLFELIDKTVALLAKNDRLYSKAVPEITQILNSVLHEYDDELVDIHTRIKSPTSLKEKIIRNKLYKEYDSPEKILDNLSDLIGIMIECRFNRNEVELFDILKKKFDQKNSDGMYYCPQYSNMYLDLKHEQPQKQKNGQEIYRIDGKYVLEGKSINFELQIKYFLVRN